MNQSPRQSLITLLFFCLLFSQISAQVVGKIAVLEDNATFIVSIIPSETIESPNNITNTGQITLKASTGSFTISTVQSLTGIWQLNTIIQHPIEAPNFDYIVFNLVTHISNPTYQAGIETPLFSFKNENGCIGSIALIDNFTDTFWPPNSLDANIGNQLTILGFGIDNAYEQNDPLNSVVTCPSSLAVELLVEEVKCAGEKGALKIVLNNGVLPFHYELMLDNQLIKGSILNRGDTAAILLPAGAYQFLGFDQVDSVQQNIQLAAPTPLQINILHQEKITCHSTDGAKVSIVGQGGLTPNSFQYNWSNGATGKEVANLQTGTYTVTLSDIHNCLAIEEIIIEAIPMPTIDSVEMYLPTCHNMEDGMIELVTIKDGTPPFRYALNKEGYQTDNYFGDLPAGTYDLNVSDDHNCVTTKRVTLENPPPLATLGIPMDTTLLLGQSTQLAPILSENTNLFYNWTPISFLSCTNCPNPIATPRNSIAYTLTISNKFGCEASYTSQIKVLQQRPIFVPNAISPNNDGENDLLEVFTGPTIAYGQHLQIYNRWGQLIYDMKNNTANRRLQWDGYIQGKPAGSGIYIYVAKLQLENGDTEIQKGDFFLLK